MSKLILLLLVIISFACCNNIKDSDHFTGQIVEFKDNVDVEKVILESVTLDEVYDGEIAIHDTLAFFWSHKYLSYWYSVFNLNSGQHLGDFVPVGNGPNEVIGILPISQFLIDESELKTLLYAFNDNRLMLWNITKSIEQKRTVYDSIIPIPRSVDRYSPFQDLFLTGKDSLFVYWQPIDKKIEITLPSIELIRIADQKSIKKIDVFRNSIMNRNSVVYPDSFFATENSYKPDGTKLVQAMRGLAQINIINLESNEVTGYRMENTADFSIFYGNMKEAKSYYSRIVSNNDYIFALWIADYSDDSSEFSTIHVFDWSGNFVKKIELSELIYKMWFDQTNNLLYGYNTITEKIYRYDVYAMLD